jgi:hypothetical protein
LEADEVRALYDLTRPSEHLDEIATLQERHPAWDE